VTGSLFGSLAPSIEHDDLRQMSAGRRLLDQLDVIKSLANRTGTVHALFGIISGMACVRVSTIPSRRARFGAGPLPGIWQLLEVGRVLKSGGRVVLAF
jgi:hypothetical protein